jgi:hypothetical protein
MKKCKGEKLKKRKKSFSNPLAVIRIHRFDSTKMWGKWEGGGGIEYGYIFFNTHLKSDERGLRIIRIQFRIQDN